MALALALSLVTCQRKSPDTLPSPAPSEPDEVLFNSAITLTNRGALTSEIKADKILRYTGQKPMLLYGIAAIFYDSLEKEEARVTADSGRAVEETRYVELHGSVRVFYTNGTKIEADSLKWDQTNDRVTSEGNVKITKKDGSILTGQGLETDPRFTTFRLKKPAGEVAVPTEKTK